VAKIDKTAHLIELQYHSGSNENLIIIILYVLFLK